jgi:methanogenic corrinoid protein MtbC1
MVITEAMAAGVPVVALAAPGVEDVVVDGENGRCVRHKDAAHLASAIVRSFVGSLNGAFNTLSLAPAIVVTTPAGQLHEIGALLAAAAAASDGGHVTYLGPSLPASEIAAAAAQTPTPPPPAPTPTRRSRRRKRVSWP